MKLAWRGFSPDDIKKGEISWELKSLTHIHLPEDT
jgi:hypothetical protein